MTVITVHNDRADYAEVEQLALKIKPGKATHRTVGFIRNKSGSKDDECLVKLLLNKAGSFWVSQEGYVYYDDIHSNAYFTLPVVVDGKVLERTENSCFDYPEAYIATIKEGVGPSREWTTDEAASILIKHFLQLRDYWTNSEHLPHTLFGAEHREKVKEATSGIIFSILSSLDGSSISLPGFCLVPYQSEEDIQYAKNMGDNYFAEFSQHVPQALPSWLHEMFHDVEREFESEKMKTLAELKVKIEQCMARYAEAKAKQDDRADPNAIQTLLADRIFATMDLTIRRMIRSFNETVPEKEILYFNQMYKEAQEKLAA